MKLAFGTLLLARLATGGELQDRVQSMLTQVTESNLNIVLCYYFPFCKNDMLMRLSKPGKLF